MRNKLCLLEVFIILINFNEIKGFGCNEKYLLKFLMYFDVFWLQVIVLVVCVVSFFMLELKKNGVDVKV